MNTMLFLLGMLFARAEELFWPILPLLLVMVAVTVIALFLCRGTPREKENR